jgi:hypothetical protein
MSETDKFLRDDEHPYINYNEAGQYLVPLLQQRLSEARRVLADFEWSGWDDRVDRRCCPKCGAIEYRERHDIDCTLDAALKGEENPTPSVVSNISQAKENRMERKWFVVDEESQESWRFATQEEAVNAATVMSEKDMDVVFFVCEAKQWVRSKPVASVREIECTS